jgi:hypothetical protein
VWVVEGLSSISTRRTLRFAIGVIIGYSFPAKDVHTRKLFLEGLADNIVNELIIVNPDSNAVQVDKDF